jgi:phosphoadenosine phosphosulfate reductase
MALLEPAARHAGPHHEAAELAGRLEETQARWRTRDLLDTAIHETFAGRIALVSSFGAESAVLLHLVASVEPSTPVLFIDTGKLFGATHRYRAELIARLGLRDIRVARPEPAALDREDADSALWRRDPNRCCGIRKVAPLARALGGFDAWISGRKRFQGGERSALPTFENDGARIKINPLSGWTKADISSYRHLHNLPEHPLTADGFRSIGCMPCTERVAEGEDDRDGRWRGRGKSECGIHLGLAALESDGSGI